MLQSTCGREWEGHSAHQLGITYLNNNHESTRWEGDRVMQKALASHSLAWIVAVEEFPTKFFSFRRCTCKHLMLI